MKRIGKWKHWFLSVLILALWTGSAGITAVGAEDSTEESVVVLACSDFQGKNDAAGQAQVSEIIQSIKQDGISEIDGFLCCGDYSRDYIGNADASGSGIRALKETIAGEYGSDIQAVLVKGNHDPVGTVGLSHSGDNDPSGNMEGQYGVFVINENDYPWFNNSESTIINTADNLRSYLEEKKAADFQKPIFVLSHLPLHYSMRTQEEGDGKYARYLFDVLNEAGRNGLNIIYLYGHNHSKGWDDYLGGSSVCLKYGDTINIATDQWDLEPQNLCFTYMNAGFVGYYSSVNEGSETALTMTLFEIRGNQVEIRRYDRNGLHDLKSRGVRNDYKNEILYAPNETVYGSPCVISRENMPEVTPTITPEPYTYTRITDLRELEEASGGKYLLIHNGDKDSIVTHKVVSRNSGSGLRTGLDLKKIPDAGADTLDGNYGGYEWEFVKEGDGWRIRTDAGEIQLTAQNAASADLTLGEEGTSLTLEGTEGTCRIGGNGYLLNYNSTRNLINGYKDSPAEFYIYVRRPEPTEEPEPTATPTPIPTEIPEPGETVYKLVTDMEQLESAEDGRYLMIYNGETDYLMTHEVVTKYAGSGPRTGFALTEMEAGAETISGDFSSYEWTLVKGENGWYLGNEQGMTTLTEESYWTAALTLTREGTAFGLGKTENGWIFDAKGYCVNYNAMRLLMNGFPGNPAPFYLYMRENRTDAMDSGTVSAKEAGETDGSAEIFESFPPADNREEGFVAEECFDAEEREGFVSGE